MGWEHLSGALSHWFAEAWARGLTGAAVDLAWIVSMLEHPQVTVTPGMRILLDSTNEGHAAQDGPSEITTEQLQSLSAHLRRALEEQGRLGEAPLPYAKGSSSNQGGLGNEPFN